MRELRAKLNLIADNRRDIILTAEDAKLALHAIEAQNLIVGALRLVLDNPNPSHPANVAARDHGRKLLELHDAIVAKHTAPNPVVLAAAKNPLEDQDVADLV